MRRLFEGGDYSKVATIRSTDVAATIYFSSTAMCRLFEVQTSRLLFISALSQCGDFSKATTIRSTDVAATIYFSSTAMRRLFEGGDYSKATTIRSTDVAATIYFSSIAMRRLFEGGYYSKYRRRGYYLFQLYRNAVTIRGRLLFISALPQCGDYSRAATIYFSSTAMRRLFEGDDYSKYRRRGYYLFQLYHNAATIRSTDVAATIYFSATAMRRLFEGGYYSRCGIYSRKYGI